MEGVSAKLCDRCAITDLLCRYAYVLDDVERGAEELLAEMFAKNAAFYKSAAQGGISLLASGDIGIAKFVIGDRNEAYAKAKRRHLMSNVVFLEISQDR